MDTCKYHPLSPATFRCNQCFTFNCDQCIDEGDGHKQEICFHCSTAVEHLGAINEAVPFWRRLEESFKYPLNTNTLIFIVLVSFVTTLAGFVPFAIIIYLALTGAFLKYCFTCLEKTAEGLFVPPEIAESYGGGLVLMVKILAITIAFAVAVIYMDIYLGRQISGLFVTLLTIALPAIIIIYGMTDDLLEAFNPMSIVRLIASIGLPYGLILAFIMVMSASVGVINELIGYEFTLVSTTLQAVVTNYYTIVMFHILGYTIFQYQGELGFTARESFGEGKEPRSERDRLAAKLDVTLKEGRYNDVVKLFDKAIKKHPKDKEFNKQYFEFLYASKRTQVIEKASTRYLHFLLSTKQDHQLRNVYKRVLQQIPQYKPESPQLRCILAHLCREGGDAISAVKLINGLHKEFPDYEDLVDAYELMADALDDIPHKQEQAAKCRRLIERLKKSNPPINKENGKGSVRDISDNTASAKKVINVKKQGRATFQTDGANKKSTFALELEKEEPLEVATSDNASTGKDLPPIEFKL